MNNVKLTPEQRQEVNDLMRNWDDPEPAFYELVYARDLALDFVRWCVSDKFDSRNLSVRAKEVIEATENL